MRCARSNRARSGRCGISSARTRNWEAPMSDRHENELNRFWNELTERGGSAARDLDAEDITLVRRLQSLAAAPLPGSAGERVWRSLAETWEVDPATSRE